MPHSLSPEAEASPSGDVQMESVTVDRESQRTEGDIPMAEASPPAVEDLDNDVKLDIKLDIKPEIKLDELFADVDSDEEFPSSAVVKDEPSSPSEPFSPLECVPFQVVKQAVSAVTNR